MPRLVAHRLIALCLSLLLATAAPALAQTPEPAPSAFAAAQQHLMIPAPDGRTIDISVWTAPEEKGVVVFSHGFGGTPAAYSRILSEWVRHSYTVVAPLHVDSLQYPDRANYDARSAFTTRIMDLAVTRGWVKRTHPGKPIIVAGHSFGSLMTTIEAGAITPAGARGDPDVRGLIDFSSAGVLPNLVTPQTYQTLTAPLLLFTGDHDVVPGFVTDWHDHRAAFDNSAPGDKTLVVFAGADHALVHNADADDFALIVTATEDFLDAYALGDAAARARLAALAAPEGVMIERR